MEIFYENHEKEKIMFSGFPVAVQNPENIINNAWQYSYVENAGARNRISAFRKEISEKTVALSVFADSPEEYGRIMEDILNVTEKDIIHNSPGKLYINGDYLECFLTAKNYTEYEEDFGAVETDITILSPYPVWIREKSYLFRAGEGDTTDNKVYPNRYTYRYANGLKNRYIENEYIAGSNFRMTIFGRVLNPNIIIGGHIYRINILLEEGERLEIDSISRTIIKVMNNGAIVNAFDRRDKRNSVFKKISPGKNQVSWPGTFHFAVIMYEERGEPKWH